MGIGVVETQTYLGLYGKKLTRPRPGGRLGIPTAQRLYVWCALPQSMMKMRSSDLVANRELKIHVSTVEGLSRVDRRRGREKIQG